MAPEAELPRAADELFALPPSEFTRQRNELSKRLKAAGDKEASQKVAALPKPSLAAWALNQVARWNSEKIDELTRIDDTLRDPKSSSEFREAAAERNRVVGEIVQAASEILEKNGHSAGAAVVGKLTQTLLATGADREARAALVKGRLSKDLEPGGLENGMWDVEVPPDTGKSPGRGGADDAKLEAERRKKELMAEIDALLESVNHQHRIASEARHRAQGARREAERADAAAEQAEEEAHRAVEAAERKQKELDGLEA